jgi:hypothetical protein
MTRRDRSLLFMLCGLMMLIGILSSSDRTTWPHLAQIVLWVWLVGYGVYTYLRPTPTTGSPYIGPAWLPLLLAVLGLTCFVASAFVLLHFYGIAGLFPTRNTAFTFFSAVLLLALSVWMVLLYFSHQRKEPK